LEEKGAQLPRRARVAYALVELWVLAVRGRR